MNPFKTWIKLKTTYLCYNKPRKNIKARIAKIMYEKSGPSNNRVQIKEVRYSNLELKTKISNQVSFAKKQANCLWSRKCVKNLPRISGSLEFIHNMTIYQQPKMCYSSIINLRDNIRERNTLLYCTLGRTSTYFKLNILPSRNLLHKLLTSNNAIFPFISEWKRTEYINLNTDKRT